MTTPKGKAVAKQQSCFLIMIFISMMTHSPDTFASFSWYTHHIEQAMFVDSLVWEYLSRYISMVWATGAWCGYLSQLLVSVDWVLICAVLVVLLHYRHSVRFSYPFPVSVDRLVMHCVLLWPQALGVVYLSFLVANEWVVIRPGF